MVDSPFCPVGLLCTSTVWPISLLDASTLCNLLGGPGLGRLALLLSSLNREGAGSDDSNLVAAVE